jgi:hypothetical protein
VGDAETVTTPPESEQFEPDLDDLADGEEAIYTDTASSKHEAWLPIDSSSLQKRQHKSTILQFYSSPLTVAQSKDRLKRVCGFSQFDEDVCTPPDIHAYTEKGKLLSVEDPALTLVRCNDMVFLAVIKVLDICVGAVSEQTLSARLVHEPNVWLRGQVMCLAMTDITHQPDAPDWKWNGLMESGAAMLSLRDIEGSQIDLVDADIHPRTQGQDIGSSTYAFRSGDLRALAAILYERLVNDLHRLPAIQATNSFPYRSEKGTWDCCVELPVSHHQKYIVDAACFVCKSDSSTRRKADEQCCRRCSDISVSHMTGPELLRHMGSHILHDPRLKDADNPCGFCLNTGTL